jgi:hypothetical protein
MMAMKIGTKATLYYSRWRLLGTEQLYLERGRWSMIVSGLRFDGRKLPWLILLIVIYIFQANDVIANGPNFYLDSAL